jgi:glucose-6-phosphate 1-dehydrogenase
MVILGATGDLTERLMVPVLCHLACTTVLP